MMNVGEAIDMLYALYAERYPNVPVQRIVLVVHEAVRGIVEGRFDVDSVQRYVDQRLAD